MRKFATIQRDTSFPGVVYRYELRVVIPEEATVAELKEARAAMWDLGSENLTKFLGPLSPPKMDAEMHLVAKGLILLMPGKLRHLRELVQVLRDHGYDVSEPPCPVCGGEEVVMTAPTELELCPTCQ